MKVSMFMFPFLLQTALTFYQDEYQIIYERLEVARYNTSYINQIETHNFKYNRSQAAVNGKMYVTKNVGMQLVGEIQSYVFVSNEYRLFPIRFMYTLCEFILSNEFGLGEINKKCEHPTPVCPIRVGWIRICNFVPPSEKFPPHVPGGRYKQDMKFFVHSVEVLFLELYFAIKYPEIRPRRIKG